MAKRRAGTRDRASIGGYGRLAIWWYAPTRELFGMNHAMA
jgi:hypothetical protein